MIPVLEKTATPYYEQIYAFYRDKILQKRMKAGERLPSYRLLARELGIGKNTVIRAYEQLIMEGYLKNEHRKGLFVVKLESNERRPSPRKTPVPSKAVERKSKRLFNPAVHLVDERHFPMKQWRKCSNWALDRASFQYEEYEESDQLKDQIINYLFKHRGVTATPERLLIGSGASALIFWLAFVLRNDSSHIAVEEPCYPRPRSIFREFGYRIHPVPVDSEGIDVDGLSKTKADLVYLTPSHQYPIGAAIPVNRRLRILQWAREKDAFIIEDDFDCEFRYRTKLMPSLQALDEGRRVIYLGSFSNALMPSLRVAYLVMPEKVPVNYQAHQYLTNTVPYFIRRTLAHFMERGYWERHLKKMRKIYHTKYHLCVEALRQLPAKSISFSDHPSGLNILLTVNTSLAEKELMKRSEREGLLITPVSEFYYRQSNRPRTPQVLLEFGSIPEDEIQKLITGLYRAWFES